MELSHWCNRIKNAAIAAANDVEYEFDDNVKAVKERKEINNK